MTFPEATIKVNAFSGVYQVVKVTNVFQGGVFKQTLQMVRRRNQLTEVSASDSDTNAYQEGKKENKVVLIGKNINQKKLNDQLNECIFYET